MGKHPEFDAEWKKLEQKGAAVNRETLRLLEEAALEGKPLDVDNAIGLWLQAMQNVGIDTEKLKDTE
jgi:hypothetical protein